MAHYIADLIYRAEGADNSDRDRLQRECADEILRLWNHRGSFRNPDRPMASYEPIYRALGRLDPENPPWTYWRGFNRDNAPTPDQLEINTLLKAALAIEEAARDAVRELILAAAHAATLKEAKWLDLAKHIDDGETGLFRAFARLRHARTDDEPDESADEEPADDAVRALAALSTACLRAREVAELHRGPNA
ncbi:hypothetical protein GCM10023170_067490 [Phytohabitans houttuyneae]|uniref:Uncharacterized protein n=2 Tax=Phytohabitans houttuyneae TaxID=1076126 RepID=A0A6V8K5T9_9ACTN|nr:hypothetical protein Phou_016990 [Phytohabitans houttuyneae]